ncbi:MAG: hypothetical protein DRQ42_00610 [Gammaproteobacteria bacterium]|nr:MAG: hypothetical protein DRQ42_00610 [Gammaproteobacteria bacterium]
MEFIGLDPSFTGTGIVRIDAHGAVIDQNLFSTDSKEKVEERLLYIVESVMEHIKHPKLPHTICMEGIAFARKSTYAAQLGALHYMLRVAMYIEDMNYIVIPPTNLKKFVTGKGNCKKDLMLLKTYRKWGIQFEDDNLCDAYGLARKALFDLKGSDTKIGKRVKT